MLFRLGLVQLLVLSLIFPASLWAQLQNQGKIARSIAERLSAPVTYKQVPEKLSLPESELTRFYLSEVKRHNAQNAAIPMIESKGNDLVLILGPEKPVRVSMGSTPGQLIINGATVNLSGLTPQAQLNKIQQTLNSKKISLQTLFISQSYAFFPITPILGLACVILLFAAVFWGPMGQKKATNFHTTTDCSSMDMSNVLEWDCKDSHLTSFSATSKQTNKDVKVRFTGTQMLVTSGEDVCPYNVDGEQITFKPQGCPGEQGGDINSALTDHGIDAKVVIRTCAHGPCADEFNNRHSAPPHDTSQTR